MEWLKSLWLKIKNRGTSKIIDSLDILEPVLASRIEGAKSQIVKLDSKALATYVVDIVQDALREHFGIKK